MPKVGNREKRPRVTRKYATADDLQKAFDAYFKNPHTVPYIYKGEHMEVYAMTMEYIAINHLGFKSKQSLYDYRKRYANEGYAEVIQGAIDRLVSYWSVAGEHGNGSFAAWMLSRLNQDAQCLKLTKDDSAVEMASKIIQAGASGDLSFDAMQKLMNAVKQKAEIEKGDEPETDKTLNINIIDAVKNAD